MPQLSQDLNELRHQARRLVLVRGMAVILGTLCGMAMTLVGVDYVLRWQWGWARWCQSITWGVMSSLVAWRYFVRPWWTPLTSQDLAKAIHRRWPNQTPDLISATEFEVSALAISQGAPFLQQVTISRGQLQLATIPWRSVIWPARAYLAVAGAVISIGLLTLSFTFASELTGVGVCRLFMPWSSLEWPQRTNLIYLDHEFRRIDLTSPPALRTAQGEILTLYVGDRDGALPPIVEYQRKNQTGEIENGELKQSTLRDENGEPRQVAIAHFPASESFLFRATGGDDERAPWLDVRVVPPPKIHAFRITLTPPAYTDLPVEETTSGVGHVQGLIGTLVDIQAESATPLQAVNLNFGSEPRRAIPLLESGRELKFGWRIASAERSTYWLDLTDKEGLRAANPPRHEVHGIADQAPIVSIDSPETDLRVTPHAVIQIEGEARDDLGLQRVELVYELPVIGTEGQVVTEQRIVPLSSAQSGSTSHVIHTTLEMSSLGLSPGTQVRYWLQGADRFDLDGATGQVGRSAIRTLSILSDEDKRNELSGQQQRLAEKLTQLRERQAGVEMSTRELHEQWNMVGSFRSDDALTLSRIQTEQKEISQQLSASSQGVLGELRKLLDVYHQNQIQDAQLLQLLQGWDEMLSPLVNDVLPQIEENLRSTRQNAFPLSEGKTKQSTPVAHAIEQAHSGQTRIIADLDKLSKDLRTWKRRLDFDQKLTEMVRKQKELVEQSVTVGKSTTAKRIDELTPQEQADIARVAERQNTLARDVDQFMSQLQENHPENDESLTSSHESQLSMARQLAELKAAATMRDIADQLKLNHIQSATEAQSNLVESLESLRRNWDQGSRPTVKNDIEQLQKALSDVADLAQKQRLLADRTATLDPPSADSSRTEAFDELSRQQDELAANAHQLAERLLRERRSDVAAIARRAQQRMQDASSQLEQESISSALEQQKEADDELGQMKSKLESDLAQTSQKADRERLAEFGELIGALIARTQAARDETIRLEELRVVQGKWTRSQLKTVQRLSDNQRELATSCHDVLSELEGRRVMSLCLGLAVEHQKHAADRLNERLTNQETQVEQTTALSLLEQFQSSLIPPAEPDAQDSISSKGSPPAESAAESSPASETLSAEVRLLLSMQEDILNRTRTLAETQATGHPLTEVQLAEHRRLSDRQRKITEAANEILQQAAASSHINPDGDSDSDSQPALEEPTRQADVPQERMP